MTSASQGPESDRLLAAVLAGEVEATAPEVVAACARDARFAADLRELTALQKQLRDRAAIVREDLATPAGEHQGAAPALVRSLLRAGARPTPLRSRLWFAAAAAIVAVALLWWRPWHDPATTQFLGNLPVERRLQHLEFRWSLAPGQFYRIQVLDGERIVATEPRWSESTWRPDADLLNRWAPQWQVLIEVRSADNTDLPWHRVRDWLPRKQ